MAGAACISIHVPRTGHDLMVPISAQFYLRFQSTCPVRGTTGGGGVSSNSDYDFNPRAPYGARRQAYITQQVIFEISIHVPRTGHDSLYTTTSAICCRFQSTCPVRGTTALTLRLRLDRAISIHVPRTGHDRGARRVHNAEIISIHVPRTGHDWLGGLSRRSTLIFQSTCPVRGTTSRRTRGRWRSQNFNPRAPYGARRRFRRFRHRVFPYFNPRAPYGARRAV